MSRIAWRVGAAVAATVIAGSVTACGAPGEGSSESGAINVVLSNHPWQRGLEPLISQLEDESGIKVNVQTFAEQQARDRILLNLQSKSSAMDVFMTLPSREGPQFSEAGYYQPLDDYLAKAPDSYKADDFSPSAINGMKDADGNVIAVPINIEGPRSEEHTSELQSRFDLVCRLLLEKKNHT